MVAASELSINTHASAMNMANTIFGDGVQVVNASYSGDNSSSGIYSGGDTTSPGVTPSDSGVMLSTGYLRNFTNGGGSANHSSSTSGNTHGVNHDPAFNTLAGNYTYDASILDVDVIPDGDTITLQFVFSSEEYPEYAGSIYNDMVGVWVNGAPVNVGVGNTSVTNVNGGSDLNQNLYVDNTQSQYNTEMDGFTVTMTVKLHVTPGELNSIRIGVADLVDSSYDSTLLIAADSGQTSLIAAEDVVDIAPGGTKVLDVLANDSSSTGSSITITQINGVDVVAGDTVTLTSGQNVTLNADGTFTIQADSDIESVNFTYGVTDDNGVTDTGYVTLNSVPCFVSGTLIATPDGEKPVEQLEPGDLVLTHDNGAQPVRWIGSRRIAAEGPLAPIRISANTFGQHRELLVSPQHRVLIRDALAELLFGDDEVLIAAKDLVNDLTVRPQVGGEVEYVHILFDKHEVVFSEGLATESFLPGPQTTKSFERAVIEEICEIFPELDPATGAGYPSSARRSLRSYEARLLLKDSTSEAA
ncbi:MAG: Hint domain-containing protein [Maritimibacter sp.]